MLVAVPCGARPGSVLQEHQLDLPSPPLEIPSTMDVDVVIVTSGSWADDTNVPTAPRNPKLSIWSVPR